MALPKRAATSVLLTAAVASLCPAQEWTEAEVLRKFLDQNPQVRESRARAAIAEAETRGRTLLVNPQASYSREGAGVTEFFEAQQTLPVSGRQKLLRQAGALQVRAVEADGAFSLWQARCSLRQAFYRLLASQQKEAIFGSGLKEIEEVIRVLRDREREGEGSKFDRLRTERERAEMLAEMALLRAQTAVERAQLLAFMPENTVLPRASGQIEPPPLILDAADLTRRALAIREDYRAEQRRIEQYRVEQQAAARLRIPEPVLSAGLKRADVGQRGMANGATIGISVPLPLFNKGQTEVARFSAELERSSARLQALTRQIGAAVAGAVESFSLRLQARNEYREQLAQTGPELVRIAAVAYQEGEVGVLQLLDAYRVQRSAQLRLLEIQAGINEAQIELERMVGEELGK